MRDSVDADMRRTKVVMKDLKRILATLVAICTLSAGALASDWQRQNDQKPPPKEQKEIPREKKPPPREDNQNRGGDKKRGKP
jgi:hypothetical protein